MASSNAAFSGIGPEGDDLGGGPPPMRSQPEPGGREGLGSQFAQFQTTRMGARAGAAMAGRAAGAMAGRSAGAALGTAVLPGVGTVVGAVVGGMVGDALFGGKK